MRSLLHMWNAIACMLVACGGGQSPTNDAFDPGPGEVAAFGLPGGLDRLRVVKTTGDTCFMIQLVTPSSGGGVLLPMDWGVDTARAMQPAAACDPRFAGPITAMFDASSQGGAIAWQGTPIPMILDDVEVTLVFTDPPAFVPPMESIIATTLAVQ